MTTRATLRSQWTKAKSVCHVLVLGDGDSPMSPPKDTRLEAVACPGRIGDYSTAPPTEPYVKISLIRFLGTARFHTARLPDVADNPRHPSPSALQHVFSRLSYV